MINTLLWKDNKLYILDQRLLPHKFRYIKCSTYLDVYHAIKNMCVRGAPAIGVSAAFGIVLASYQKNFSDLHHCVEFINRAAKKISISRPTAVNLSWAVERIMRKTKESFKSVKQLRNCLEDEAKKIYEDDILINKKIGENGASLIKKDSRILTHCNAGALATAGYGTALGIIRSAYSQKKVKVVFVDETRPYLQGARLTAWELRQEKIPYILITDNMAGYFMKLGLIDAVIVGADRIALNGDVANKIGTYSLAILAKYHNIPFYVAAPISTIDLDTPSGKDVVIEERSPKEILYVNGKLIAPQGTIARHPAFDVTPAELITAIVTERGIFKPALIKTYFKK